MPGYCIEEVAVHAVGMALDLAENHLLSEDVKRGYWNMDYAYPAPYPR